MPLAYETINALTGDKALVKKNNALSCGCCYGCEDLRLSLDAMFAGAVAAGPDVQTVLSPTVTVSNQRGFTENVTLTLTLSATPPGFDFFATFTGGGTGSRMSVSFNGGWVKTTQQRSRRGYVGGRYEQFYIWKYYVIISVRDNQLISPSCQVPYNSWQTGEFAGYAPGTMPSGTRLIVWFIDYVENWNTDIFGDRTFIDQVLAGPFRLIEVTPSNFNGNFLEDNQLAPETVCNYSNANGIDISPDPDWIRDRILSEQFDNLDFSNPSIGPEQYGWGMNVNGATEIAPVAMLRRDASAWREFTPSRYPEDYPIQWTTPTIDSTRLCLDHSVSFTNHYMPDSCNAGHTITGLDDFLLNFLP